jgi:hypothetical protein
MQESSPYNRKLPTSHIIHIRCHLVIYGPHCIRSAKNMLPYPNLQCTTQSTYARSCYCIQADIKRSFKTRRKHEYRVQRSLPTQLCEPCRRLDPQHHQPRILTDLQIVSPSSSNSQTYSKPNISRFQSHQDQKAHDFVLWSHLKAAQTY